MGHVRGSGGVVKMINTKSLTKWAAYFLALVVSLSTFLGTASGFAVDAGNKIWRDTSTMLLGPEGVSILTLADSTLPQNVAKEDNPKEDWITYKDETNNFSMDHPRSWKRTQKKDVLYAVVGTYPSDDVIALVFSKQKDDNPLTSQRFEDTIEGVLQASEVSSRRIYRKVIGTSDAYVSEASYKEKDGTWFSLIAVFELDGYLYTLAGYITPVNDPDLKDILRRAVFSLKTVR